jgi:hypothetical protein
MAYRDLLSSDSLKSGDLPPDFPSEFLKEKRRGMFLGPLAYLKARVQKRRAP